MGTMLPEGSSKPWEGRASVPRGVRFPCFAEGNSGSGVVTADQTTTPDTPQIQNAELTARAAPGDLCQRWRTGRSSYRPAGEVIDTRAFEVAALGELPAKAFVTAHHYSGTYPAARWRFGLYRGVQLVGVAVFSHPSNDKALTSVFPGDARESVELGRFVLLDEVPGNGETWFLARAFALLRREGLRGVVSFSDPLPRADTAGRIVAPGHIGTIYQAHNAAYLGRATPRTLHLLPDGTVFSARAQQKIRKQECGWRYAVEQLVAAGLPKPSGPIADWLRSSVASLRRVRHPGNHRYAWSFSRRERLVGGAYPKAVFS